MSPNAAFPDVKENGKIGNVVFFASSYYSPCKFYRETLFMTRHYANQIRNVIKIETQRKKERKRTTQITHTLQTNKKKHKQEPRMKRKKCPPPALRSGDAEDHPEEGTRRLRLPPLRHPHVSPPSHCALSRVGDQVCVTCSWLGREIRVTCRWFGRKY